MPLSTAGDGLFNRASEIPQVRRTGVRSTGVRSTGVRSTGVRLANRGIPVVRTAGSS